eukprot:TRINITY_DN3682_c0_g1_i1.p1 TRINITY_DN3682_c0_g1~~TRINITY_DN3682_c0_g1_i1.p1  ORF type:complete len:200 (+),score=73.25 TRINITY_DN3682_c0_g1_i1:224-823(+)
MLTVSQKIEEAKKLKEEGNKFFQGSEWRKALGSYHRSLLYVKGLDKSEASGMMMMKEEHPITEEEKKEIEAVFLVVHLNMAAVYLKISEWTKAINSCGEAIKLDPKNAKAYFRRSQAYLSQRDVDRSEVDCKQALKLAPSDKAIKVHQKNIEREKERQNEKQKKAFKGMFGKVSLYDNEESKPSENTSTNDKSDKEENK